jgi:uncharacterized metal-binding protein
MPELPQKKVGIVACSGEELAVGTVTRLAALKVLEDLRPSDTVTICLPLFLAGGEGDRAFAKFYPTIAIDGCQKRCAARGTEMYSGKPAASVVVTDICMDERLDEPSGLRRLDDLGMKMVDVTAVRVAGLVDELLEKRWSRRTGEFVEEMNLPVMDQVEQQEKVVASCACGSGIPVLNIEIDGERVSIIALPLIFDQMISNGKTPDTVNERDLLDTVRIYNSIPDGAEDDYVSALLREYAAYCLQNKVPA